MTNIHEVLIEKSVRSKQIARRRRRWKEPFKISF